MKKFMAMVLAAIIFLDVICLGVILFTGAEEKSQAYMENTDETDPVFERATVVAVGNNFIEEKLLSQAKARVPGDNYDFAYIYEKVSDFVSSADAAIINQEGLISESHAVSGEGLFNSPPQLGDEIIKAGFNVVNIASNHALDYGEQGLINTLDYWATKENVLTVGAFKDKTLNNQLCIQKVNGIKIAYVAFTETANGNNLPSDSQCELSMARYETWLCDVITRANKKADVVVVLAHWGNEYETEVSPAQRALAEKMAGWGASVIIGSHPHVIQPVEYIDGAEGRQTLVAWSLGNFISAQAKPEHILGGMLCFDIVKNPENYKVTIENVRVRGLVTHFGMNMSNIRVYLLDDYNEELASKHGLNETYDGFSAKHLKKLFGQYVDKQFRNK